MGIAASLVAGGCSDDLDATPDGRLTMEEVFNNPEHTAGYLSTAWKHTERGPFMHHFFENFFTSISDEAWSTDDYQPLNISFFYDGTNSAAKSPWTWDSRDQGKWEGNYWRRYWETIRILNQFLENIPTAAVNSESDRSLFTAEARILRAYYYNRLAKMYGGLPLITWTTDVSTSYDGVERTPAWKVFQWCVEECEEALKCDNLPWHIESQQQRDRMTKGIACAIISQASLFAASPLFCEGQDLWQYAYEKNKEAFDLLTANGYELYSHLNAPKEYPNAYAEYFSRRSFANTCPDDKETIWGCSSKCDVMLCVVNAVPRIQGQFKAGVCPSQELVDAYDMLETGEPIYDLSNPYVDEKHTDINVNSRSGYDPQNPYVGRDPRFYATIIYDGCSYNTGVRNEKIRIYSNKFLWTGERTSNTGKVATKEGNCHPSVNDRLYTRTGYYNRKFHTYKATEANGKDEGNWKLFRLGEVYLNYAEAAAEAGHTDEAMTLVNAIRHRAGFAPAVDRKASSRDEARLIVHHERHVELAYEEHRYFDVRRWQVEGTDIKEERWQTGVWISTSPDNESKGLVYTRFPLGKSQGTEPSSATHEAQNRLMPIPLTEENNLNAATGIYGVWQNWGW